MTDHQPMEAWIRRDPKEIKKIKKQQGKGGRNMGQRKKRGDQRENGLDGIGIEQGRKEIKKILKNLKNIEKERGKKGEQEGKGNSETRNILGSCISSGHILKKKHAFI